MLRSLHTTILDLFSSRKPATIISVSLILLVLLGILDYSTGDYSLIVFYLIPVSLTAWFVSRKCGFFFCVLSVATRFIADEAPTSFAFHNAALHYWNEFIEFLFLVIMSQLFSSLRRNLDSEKTLASTDPLTGALNRRAFFDIAEYEINRSNRYSHPTTIAYIDLDNFKEINDNLGHHTGDNLLVAATKSIMANIRNTDILSRFGGDEFVLLLPETPGDAAKTFLNKIHGQLNAVMAENRWPVSFSIGAITYTRTPPSAEEVIKKADMLMYEVKRNGKDRLLHMEIPEESHG